MNKIIGYCILLIIYLGLSKSLSPSEFGISYVNSNESLAKFITESPVSVILTDIHSTGFLIKTYYHKYKVVYGFQAYEELIVRTSKKFKEANQKFLGMSVMRKSVDHEVSFTPLPPGSIFIGNKNFGRWKRHPSGDRIWSFFRVYRQIPKHLGWSKYTPTKETLKKISQHIQSDKPFFGKNEEFGSNGVITKKSFPQFFERQQPEKFNFSKLIQNYFKENFIK